MPHIYDLLAAFANCNLHFCIYGAFGATIMLRAFLFRRPDHSAEEARENFVHGVVYLCLGLLK